MRLFPDIEPGRNLFVDQFIQLFKLNMGVPDADCLHSAADIHSHQIRDRLVADCHRGSDGASGSRMDVGHNPDPAPR